MKPIKLDETDYTNILAGDLNSYVKQHTSHNLPAPSTPHSTRQSYKKINKSSCFDLIQRISDSSLLVLEVKVTHDGIKLHSFHEQQRQIDAALREIGIPIEYCYNTKEDYSEKNDPTYTLLETMSSHPSFVSDNEGKIIQIERHQKLKLLVDKLLDASGTNAGMIGALFSKGLISRMRDLNIKALFFSANAGDLTLYTEKDIYDIYKCYQKYVTIGDGIDLNTASFSELVEEFKTNAQQLKNVLSEWDFKKNIALHHETTPASNYDF